MTFSQPNYLRVHGAVSFLTAHSFRKESMRTLEQKSANAAGARKYRKTAKYRARHPLVPLRTHCIQGHEFTEANTYFQPDARYASGYNRKCRACHSAKQRRTNQTPFGQAAIHKRSIARAGWTPEAYDAAHAKQQGLCAICKRPETGTRNGKIKKLAADHCHTANKPRELLCQNCNRALGLLEDNPDRMIAASEYIKKH